MIPTPAKTLTPAKTKATAKSQAAPVRVLTPAEAASIVFNVQAPSIEQIGRIVSRINSGVIRRSEKGGMTTTTEAIAEFLVKRQQTRPNPETGKSSKSPGPRDYVRVLPTADRQDVNEELASCYRHFMRDYFRAILFQRISGQLSAFLRTAVLVTQIVALASILLFAVVFIKGVGTLISASPREKAAAAWLKEHFPNSELEQMSVFANQPDTVRVKFSYIPEMRRSPIHNEINFRFQGNQLVKAFGDDDDEG